MRADLHIHTYYSDGTQSPLTVAEAAKSAGLELIAVTDHDGMAASAEVGRYAAERGIKTVAGIEVSAYKGTVKFHTLGYGMDEDKFSGFLKRLYESSYIRAEDIISKLRKIGFDITMDDVDGQRYSPNAPVHGMHIARAMVEKGFVDRPNTFFKKYVAYGKPAFSCIHRPSPEETCEAIVAAGGFASVAHPARIRMEAEELKNYLVELKAHGLGGIEVYYTTHTEEQTRYYEFLADEFDLIKTGGSDTHNADGTRVIGQPAFDAGGALLEKLKIV